jgi:hypothetical protein
LLLTALLSCGTVQAQKSKGSSTYNIDPNTPAEQLLPAVPKHTRILEPVLTEDLADVPEVAYQDPPDKGLSIASAEQEIGMTLSKISLLNKQLNLALSKTPVLNPPQHDGFVLAVMTHRPDMQGLPFLANPDCRQSVARAVEFKAAVLAIRAAMSTAAPSGLPMPLQTSAGHAKEFWNWFRHLEQSLEGKTNKVERDHVYAGVVTALAQVFGSDTLAMHLTLVKYLNVVPHAEATRTLARMALFSPEKELREAALEVLKSRREKDYTDILLKALRYPWPEVVRHATSAVVDLGRTDLIPELVALLDEPDPRMPQLKKYDGKEVYLAHQLVRVNHHRNCMLCHAPVQSAKALPETLTAGVPLACQKLPPMIAYYNNSLSQASVRVDVTYLRQDFSLVQTVPNAHPWPDQQRFDYLVRTVVLTKEQAKDYEFKLFLELPASVSPHRAAALTALRTLTGLDAGPTAAAWRKALKLSS